MRLSRKKLISHTNSLTRSPTYWLTDGLTDRPPTDVSIHLSVYLSIDWILPCSNILGTSPRWPNSEIFSNHPWIKIWRYGLWYENPILSLPDFSELKVLILINRSIHFIFFSIPLCIRIWLPLCAIQRAYKCKSKVTAFNTLQVTLSTRTKPRLFIDGFIQTHIFTNAMTNTMVCSKILTNYVNNCCGNLRCHQWRHNLASWQLLCTVTIVTSQGNHWDYPV